MHPAKLLLDGDEVEGNRHDNDDLGNEDDDDDRDDEGDDDLEPLDLPGSRLQLKLNLPPSFLCLPTAPPCRVKNTIKHAASNV